MLLPFPQLQTLPWPVRAIIRVIASNCSVDGQSLMASFCIPIWNWRRVQFKNESGRRGRRAYRNVMHIAFLTTLVFIMLHNIREIEKKHETQLYRTTMETKRYLLMLLPTNFKDQYIIYYKYRKTCMFNASMFSIFEWFEDRKIRKNRSCIALACTNLSCQGTGGFQLTKSWKAIVRRQLTPLCGWLVSLLLARQHFNTEIPLHHDLQLVRSCSSESLQRNESFSVSL